MPEGIGKELVLAHEAYRATDQKLGERLNREALKVKKVSVKKGVMFHGKDNAMRYLKKRP